MNAKDIKLQHIPKMYNMRTIRGNGSFDDSSLNLAIMDLLYSRELLISTKNELQESLPAFSLSIVGTDVKQWADSIRQIFKLELKDQCSLPSKRKFYLYIRNKIEKQGVFIQGFSGVDTEIARGVAIYNDIYPIIGINNDDRYPAKTFSISRRLLDVGEISKPEYDTFILEFKRTFDMEKEIEREKSPCAG